MFVLNSVNAIPAVAHRQGDRIVLGADFRNPNCQPEKRLQFDSKTHSELAVAT